MALALAGGRRSAELTTLDPGSDGVARGVLRYSSLTGAEKGVGGGDAQQSRRRVVVVLLVTLAIALGLSQLLLTALSPEPRRGTTSVPGPAAVPACTKQLQPTRDLETLANDLRPGDVACLAPGTYGARGTRTDWAESGTPGRPITVRASGEDPVLLRGFVNVAADHVVFDGVVFDGPSGPVSPGNDPHGEEVLVWAQGDDLTFRRCEVRNGLWRAGIFVTGVRVTIDSCYVHDIGPWSDPDQEQVGGRANNIDHGVYWGENSSGTLVNSVVEHNLAYGVQISGEAFNVLVANNTIVRNGAGGVIWAEDTSGSTLANNIVAFNDGYAVNAHLLTGTSNVARNNLAWGNGRGEWNDNGPLIMRRNQIADPMFVADGDYRLRPESQAIDAGSVAGSPSHDLAGNPRPQGEAPDIGAYEWSAETPVP